MKMLSKQKHKQSKTQIDPRVLESDASAKKRIRQSTVHITVSEPDFVGSKRPGLILLCIVITAI